MTPSRRILVVDDVADNVAMLFDFLRGHGFTVLVSDSGRQVLDTLTQIAPDLVLLDVMMPEPDGFETCRRIKADPVFADVPVLFMSALSEPVDKVRGLAVGAADFITKPIFPEEVLARIKVHLDLHDRNRELAEQNERLDAAIQRQVSTERALRESLDRAVIVADAQGRAQFVADSAGKLLRRFFPDHAGDGLPATVAAWLRGTMPTLTATREGWRLELVRGAASGTDSRLVYLDGSPPPPTPEALLSLGLTPRETEILFWVAHGKTSPEIGIIVGIAPATVKKHVANITAKLGVETRLAAALKAMEVLGFS